ncbi:MAG TPA: MFS transporter, partial [Puia sp.]|nr:MFS transporter [Puia sp.]
RSINGPFLEILGASGAIVGIVAGFGEFIGYALRLATGYYSDRSHKYWFFLISGYIINLFSVPLLALAGNWQLAALLMILERTGKAIRNPTRDAMLSYASKETGRGWGFGLHEFMDQLGATLGPLIVSAILFFKHDNFHLSYLVLLIPAIFAMSVLAFAKKMYPDPHNLEFKKVDLHEGGRINSKLFVLYTIASMCFAAGYADFPLIAFHFKQASLFGDGAIPLLYSLAMLTEAVTALIAGRMLDKSGLMVLVIASIASMFFAPLVFLLDIRWAIAGMVLWGIGMGIQGSVMKAIIPDIVPGQRRATAFGLYDTFYGAAWFCGSALMGFIYDRSLVALVVFSIVVQLAGTVLLFIFTRFRRNQHVPG